MCNSCRTTTAKIPHQSMDYFKMGDNLIRRVKSARPVSRPGELQQLQFRDFAIVSPSHSIPASSTIAQCTALEMLLMSPTSSATALMPDRPSPSSLINLPTDSRNYPRLFLNTHSHVAYPFQC